MPQLFLVFNLSCASGYLPRFLPDGITLCLGLYNYVLCDLWGLVSLISLCFFIIMLVGDDILGFFCVLVCFATVASHFVGSFQSCPYLEYLCHLVLLLLRTCF